jgi:hypothetical protein
MARNHNTNVRGGAFTEDEKKQTWKKGIPIPNYDENVWRKDKCGDFMKWPEYGNRSSAYGWEIDHICPVAKNGTDDPNNLQPLNWSNNASKGDKYPWKCGE